MFPTIKTESFAEWLVDESADLMYLYKDLQHDVNYAGNWKELSKRMHDCGWERDNNSCRQKV